MDFRTSKIKDAIVTELSDVFSNGSPVILDLKPLVDRFFDVITHSSGVRKLGGLQLKLPAALRDIFENDVTSQANLDRIKDDFEPFLKKVGFLSGRISESEITNGGFLLYDTMIRLGLWENNSAFGSPKSVDWKSLEGKPEYVKEIAAAYQCRNELSHTSPLNTKREISTRISDFLVAMIYSIHKTSGEIVLDGLSHSEGWGNVVNQDDRYVYDFISFGALPNKIRGQVVDSFILNFLRNQESCSKEEIMKEVNLKLNTNFGKSTFDSVVATLIQKEKIIVVGGVIKLELHERQRIERVHEEFEDNRKLFWLFLNDILNEYELGARSAEIFVRLKHLFSSNFDIDIAESFDRGFATNSSERKVVEEFVGYLSTILREPNKSGQLFKKLASLSIESDFLLRICAGRAIANAVNLDERFQNYIRQTNRKVFLDTDVTMYLMMMSYSPSARYDHAYYKSVEGLLEVMRKANTFKVYVSSKYLDEIAFQIKLALLLAPIIRTVKSKSRMGLSSNIFYRFWSFMYEEGLLEPSDEDFGAFIRYWFRIEEEDLESTDYFGIAKRCISSILKERYGVLIAELDYTTEDLRIAKGTISEELEQSQGHNYRRSSQSIMADAFMLTHLCDDQSHEIESTFLTWDKKFDDFRKSYLEKVARRRLRGFHLFTPSKFVNHFSILNLRVDPDSIAAEFLALVDGYELYGEANTVYDALNKFLMIDGLNLREREDRIVKLKAVLDREFSFELLDAEAQVRQVAQPLDQAVSLINNHFERRDLPHGLNLSRYRDLLRSNDSYEKVMVSIVDYIKQKNDSTFLNTLDELIRENNS